MPTTRGTRIANSKKGILNDEAARANTSSEIANPTPITW